MSAVRVRPVLVAAVVPAFVACVVYCVFSIVRHERFGSGAWDMGCYVHNLFILGFGKPPVSSVLGDAAFWGGTNHFMPSLYLAAPLAWTGWTSSLLVLQALLVAGAVIPLALWAERRGLGPAPVAAVSAAYLFAVGTQSMIEFDVHEIAPVPLCLFVALWAFETNRRPLAYASLLVMAGTKESAILYAAAVGAYLLVFVRGRRVEGAVITGALAAWFVVVVQVLQPAFIEEGARMIHVERFEGGMVGLLGRLVLHPFDTLAQLVSPAPKGSTLATTAGGFGFLPLLSPAAWLLAAPTLVERFLSNKREMWGLGFHYSLALVSVCAFGALDVIARLKAWRARTEHAAAAAVSVGFVLSLALSPVTPDFKTLHKPYMADDARIERYHRALALIPGDAKVVAQNHLLPHLAFRQFIWMPERKFVERADYVILDVTDSPWPHTRAHVTRLASDLEGDSAWRAVFSEGSTRVFARAPAVAVPSR
jgi:uncharacterized membrane protein